MAKCKQRAHQLQYFSIQVLRYKGDTGILLCYFPFLGENHLIFVSCLLFVCFQEKDYVGFATLPNQVHRKSVKKGFDFTLMVAGTKLSIYLLFFLNG